MMKSLWLPHLLLLFALACAGPPPSLPALDELAAKLDHHDVSGQVLFGGAPVPGAEVLLYYELGECGLRDRLAARTRTDPQGNFKFDKALAWEPEPEIRPEVINHYDLVAAHPDYGVATRLIKQSDPLEKIKINLNRPETHEVHVTDPEGRGLEGVHVYLGAMNGFCCLNQDLGIGSGATGLDGKLRLSGPAHAQYWFVKDGFAKTLSTETEVVLPPGARITGRVTDERGAPVPDAGVWLNYSGNGFRDAARTGKDGRYAFPNAPAGSGNSSFLRFEDLRPGSRLAPAHFICRPSPGETLRQDATLRAGVRLAGTVVDFDTGKPVAHFPVLCAFGGDPSTHDPGRLRYSDESGRFEFTVARGSHATLSCGYDRQEDRKFDREWLKTSREHELSQYCLGDAPGLVLKARFLRLGTLSGRVVDAAGDPVREARITISGEISNIGLTGRDGSFTVPHLPLDRDWEIFAQQTKMRLAALGRLKAGQTSITLTLQPTRDYAGQVLSADGQPAPGLAFNLLLRLNGGPVWIDNSNQPVRADAQGQFVVPSLCPAAVYSAAWSSYPIRNEPANQIYAGLPGTSALFNLPALAPGEPLRIRVNRFDQTLAGRVCDPQGRPIEFARISVYSDNLLPLEKRFPFIITGKAGRFTIRHLAAGDSNQPCAIEMLVRAAGFKPRKLFLPGGAPEAPITLRPRAEGLHFTATVVDPADRPLPNMPVSFCISEVDNLRWPRARTTVIRTDAAGRAEYQVPVTSELPMRFPNIYCIAPGFRVDGRQIPQDQDADIRLVMHPAGELFRGEVLDEAGRPVRNARITLTGVKGGRATTETQSGGFFFNDEKPLGALADEQGRFELAGVDPARVSGLAISAVGYASERLANTVRNGERYTLQRAGVVRGRVVMKAGGRPVSSGRIRADRLYDALPIDANGYFQAADLKPGAYNLHYLPSREEDLKWVHAEPLRIVAAPDKPVQAVLQLEEGLPVGGTIVNAQSGRPLPGICSLDVYKGSELQQRIFALDGAWRTWLPEGDYALECHTSLQKNSMRQSLRVTRGKSDLGNMRIAITPDLSDD